MHVLTRPRAQRPIDPAMVADIDDSREPPHAQNAESRTAAARVAVESEDIFAKAYAFKTAEQARARGLYPYFRPFDCCEGPEAILEGRRVLMFGSNNYLGLTMDARVRGAAREAADRWGPGASYAGVDTEQLQLLEERLARFLGKESVLVFAAGYLANTASISCLLNEERTVAIVDRNVHASIYDGVRLAQARGTRLLRYKHNDARHLKKTLEQTHDDERVLVITDGVFSAEGELAPLPEIVEVVKAHGARLMIDDAHGLGGIGPGGRGTAAHFQLTDRVDLITGTFSKSLASIGGWLAADRGTVEFIRKHASGFCFASRLPAPSAAAAMAALAVLEAEPWRVARLHENSTHMRTELRGLGFDIGASQTAVVPIYIRKDLRTLLVWKELLETHGVYTNPFISPGVPPNHAMLRTSYMATHSAEQLGRGLSAFYAAGKKFGIVT